MLKFENEVIGEATQSVVDHRRHIVLPPLDYMNFDDLRYIADAIDEYAGEVQAMLEQKREERIAELRARLAEDQAALAELCPPAPANPAKLVNPSTPKYRDPAKPECTWAGRGKQPGWLKEKLEAGASLDDFLIDKPTVPSSSDDPGF